MSQEAKLPDIAEALRGFLDLVPKDQQPLLIALAERLAAERYRQWAAEVTEPLQKSGLMACADREEEIARRIEGLYPHADAIQADIIARNLNLRELGRSLFGPRSLRDQFALQAQGERLGAATWRSMARKAESADTSNVLLGCALLEEESAAFLESLL